MGKIITYTCDHCEKPIPLEVLHSVTAHVYEDNLEDPKILDMEMVCPECRVGLTDLISKWADNLCE